MLKRLFTGAVNLPFLVLNVNRDEKTFPKNSCLTSQIVLLLMVLFIAGDVLAQVQIVNCDAPVQSRKRGIAVNSNMSAADFQALAPGVSWFYDWGINNWTVPSGVA